MNERLNPLNLSNGDGLLDGRNLLLKSGTPIKNNAYHIAQYTLAEIPKDGEIVTVQIKGQLGAGKSAFAFYSGDTLIEYAHMNAAVNGIYKATFAWKNPTEYETVVHLYTYYRDVVVDSQIEWIKLERGSVATDWTPAPEDILDVFSRLTALEAKAGIVYEPPVYELPEMDVPAIENGIGDENNDSY